MEEHWNNPIIQQGSSGQTSCRRLVNQHTWLNGMNARENDEEDFGFICVPVSRCLLPISSMLLRSVDMT